MSEPHHDETEQARVLVGPGDGVLSRRGSTLLFFPNAPDAATLPVVERLLADLDDGFDADHHADLHADLDDGFELDVDNQLLPPYAYVDWRSGLRCMATIELDHDAEAATVGCSRPDDATAPLTDLSNGTVRAGGFCVVLPATVPPAPLHDAGARAVDPPQFAELSDLDTTLTPLGPVTYPDDDTDRTTQQPFDVRCRNGHANARLTTTCGLCGEAIDTTARRSTLRPAEALAGVEIPDGRVVPIDQTLIIGRDPQAVAARVEGRPRLIRLDAPAMVSRTHLVVRLENRAVTVTDCDSRGRSALLRAGSATPVALTPWEPTEVSIGDAVHLGGPTTLRVVAPSRRPAADPTERPRDES